MAKPNELLLKKILENVPKSIKPIAYLMNLLELSSESVYRRMRGDVSFTFDEITKLSVSLNFSLDEIIGNDNEKRIFFDLQDENLEKPDKVFLTMLENLFNYSKRLSNANNSESIVALSKINPLFVVDYTYLFKFFYYKWVQQTGTVPFNYSFSELTLSKEINYMIEKFRLNFFQYRSNFVTVILDQFICSNTIKEINYYYKRGLINDDELILIKQDLTDFLDSTEKLVQTGISKNGSKYHFYLSSFNIESNTIYTEHDSKFESQFWIYTVNPIVISNLKVASTQKRWLNSLKRYSTLITQSNEIRQSEFFSKQREYIDQLGIVQISDIHSLFIH
jgi:hypothetical protein